MLRYRYNAKEPPRPAPAPPDPDQFEPDDGIDYRCPVLPMHHENRRDICSVTPVPKVKAKPRHRRGFI